MDSAARRTLTRVRFVSRGLDDSIRIPGTNRQFGLDPVFNLVPVGGNALGTLFSLYPVVEAYRLGVPRWTLLRMLVNVGLDALGGSIPVLGVLFDAVWKANERNVALLEGYLESGRARRESKRSFQGDDRVTGGW